MATNNYFIAFLFCLIFGAAQITATDVLNSTLPTTTTTVSDEVINSTTTLSSTEHIETTTVSNLIISSTEATQIVETNTTNSTDIPLDSVPTEASTVSSLVLNPARSAHLVTSGANLKHASIGSASITPSNPSNSPIKFSTRDLTLLVNETFPFEILVPANITNSSAILSFKINGTKHVVLDPPALELKSLQNERHAVYVFATKPGRYVILANLTSNELFDISKLFVRVVVVYSYNYIKLSSAVGWIYTLTWSISFWPQIIKNFQRKSVVGLNFDFVGLSLLGQTLYGSFNYGLYFSGYIETEYLRRHPSGQIPVKINDVFFSSFAILACIIYTVQCCIYERGGQSVSKPVRWVFVLFGGILATISVCTVLSIIHLYDFLLYCGYINLSISLMKYSPQAIMNYRRKSTAGYSIKGVISDLIGGLFSMLQMLIDGYNYDDFASVFGDPTKFGLGLVSVLFDCLFLIQRYALYPHKYAVAAKSEPIDDTKYIDQKIKMLN